MHKGRPCSGDRVQFDNQEYCIKRVIVHPDYSQSGRRGRDSVNADLALLELTEPVAGIEPIKLNIASKELEQPCTIVGFGLTGIIAQGQPPHLDPFVAVKRAGTNMISRITEDEIITQINPSPVYTGPTQDAALGVGDSGGPLLIEVNGQLVVAGVVEGFRMGTDDDLLMRKNNEDHYVRVSRFVNWIEDTTGHSFGKIRIEKWLVWTSVFAAISLVVATIVRRRWRHRTQIRQSAVQADHLPE